MSSVVADAAPRVGVTSVGEVARTTSPVPVQVKRDEVAIEAASAVEPVMLPRTEFAATCARFENGRSPDTSAVRETVAHVATPAPFKERTNWLVQDEPAYSPSEPSAAARGMAEVMPEIARLVVVAFVVVAKVAKVEEAMRESGLPESQRPVEVAFTV